MSRGTKAILIAVMIVVGIQLIRPAKTNPVTDPGRTIQAHVQVPPQVNGILQQSCGDCHSHNTRWPWYSNVAPVSWMVIDDVNEGRRELNFSDWARYDAKRQMKKLEQICEEAREGGMPLISYTWAHAGTRLTPDQRQTLCDWSKAEQQRLAAAHPAAVASEKNKSND